MYFCSRETLASRVERRDAAGRVPGGARGQLVLLDQHDVGPADLREMIEHGDADDAAADHDDAGRTLHGR